MDLHFKGFMIVLVLASVLPQRVSSEQVPEDLQKLARASNAFAIHLYQTLRAGNEGKNLFFSPLGVASALSLLESGTKGASSSQIVEVLGLKSVDEMKRHESFAKLNSALYKSTGDYLLRSASKLLGKTGAEFSQEFLKKAEDVYDTNVQKVDSFDDPELAKVINNWVSKRTEGKVSDLVSHQVLAGLAGLVYVNAMYFKGKWDRAFDPEVMETSLFKVSHETIHMRMMKQNGWYEMTDDKTRKCFVLELPYENGDLSMMAVLPWKPDGLTSVENVFDEDALDFWYEDLLSERAFVEFPKFSLDDTFDLSSTLASMGVADPFSSTSANFEGITSEQSLYLSKMLHKASLEVDEKGSGAGVATPPPGRTTRPYQLKFTYPFMFFIRDRRTGTILFLGRMVDPPHDSRVIKDEL
ncbi:leukocyte elastase inhibitor-like [Diadema setosum]|uniref:leukocyte elastase inhibitor-like n=1 Tax=Diadema setosum TaxID=31175 RepID=UPI003B3A424C